MPKRKALEGVFLFLPPSPLRLHEGSFFKEHYHYTIEFLTIAVEIAPAAFKTGC